MNPFLRSRIFLMMCCWSVFSTALCQDSASLILQWSKEAGIYPASINVEIKSNSNAQVYYTTDGSKPSQKSKVYKKGISINRTTIIKAIAISGNRKSSIETNTFFIGESSTFPFISIGVKPSKLFHIEKGLFRMGPKADTLFPYYGANFWSRDEIKIHLEYFEPQGDRVVAMDGGMRMFGGMSRLFAQKSMAVVARDKYGPKRIKYQVFKDKSIDRFKYLALRNSGSDWGKSHLRDAYFTDLVKDLDFETQAFQPTHTFINGKYWGIYNAREKINRFFLSSNTGYHKDSLEIIEHRNNVRRGNGRHYRNMIRFIERHDLDVPENYSVVKSMMEVSSFMDHQIVQIYLDNRDAGGNIKYWRPNQEGGRWRWILYDTDFGMGLHAKKAYRKNSLDFHTEANGSSWPNPPWSTFLLRNLLENEEFETEFLRRFCDHLNTVFKPDHMTQKLDDMVSLYEPEIDRHLKRWKLRTSRRQTHLDRMYEFIEKRPPYVRRFLKKRFSAEDEVGLIVRQNRGGQIVLNDHLPLKSSQFQGRYFGNLTLSLEALPYFGYQFDHWEINNGQQVESPRIDLPLEGQSQSVRAVYKHAAHPLEGKIVINEISSNDPASGDWIELYNQSDLSVNLHDWYLRDQNQDWQLPVYELKSEAFVVLCRDSAAFRRVFDASIPILGNVPFGISRTRERLELYTSYRAPIDSLSYWIPDQDSIFTLALQDPKFENRDLDFWDLEVGSGSPGEHNPVYVEAVDRERQRRQFMILGGVGIILFLLLLFAFSRQNTTEESD